MMKSIAPMWDRLRHLPRPPMFRVRGHQETSPDEPTVGQRMAELVAAGVGSWWFLGIQACFLFLWLVYNTIQISTHFDPPPYILLNLLLSFQAAFTGPVLLIAANVGAKRDHKQADRIEHLGAQNQQLAEQSAQLAERLISLEQTLDEHVAQSLQAHTDELRQLGALVREVHAVVCQTPTPDGATSAAGLPSQSAPPAPVSPEPALVTTSVEQQSQAPGPPRGRVAPGGRTPRKGKATSSGA